MINLDYKAIIAAAVVGALAVYLLKRGALAAVETIGAAVNPVSNENIFYTGIGSAVDAVAGGESAPLGSRIYDWLN